MEDHTSQVIEGISQDILELARFAAEKNGISGRRFHDGIGVIPRTDKENVIFDILFNDYISYLETGRKPRSGKMPPVSALRDWALSKNIPATNDVLFAIANFIWQNGQKPRPILMLLEKEMENVFDEKWSDEIFEAVIKDLINR